MRKLLRPETSSGAFWKLSKSAIGLNYRTGVPSLIDQNNNELITSTEKADAFAKMYAEKLTIKDAELTQIPTFESRTSKRLKHVRFKKSETKTLLNQINTSKATGPDGISGRVLKATADVIAPHVTRVFQKLFFKSCFPDQWKIHNVAPVYKKKSKSEKLPTSLSSYNSLENYGKNSG
jgi:hypothetical protein